MRKSYRILLIILILLFSLSMLGCQNKDKKTLSPESMLEEAANNLASANSIDTNMTMEFSMSSNSDTFDINMKSQIIAFTDPYKAKLNMDIDMGALGSQRIESYLLYEDKNYNLYTSINGSWSKTVLDQDSFSKSKNNSFNPLSVDLYQKNAKSFKNTGTEKLSNISVVKLEGMISGDSINDLLKNTSLINIIEENFTDVDNLDTSLFRNLDDIPMTIWIDEETMLPVKMSLDMTTFVQNIVDKFINNTSTENSSLVGDSSTNNISEPLSNSDVEIPKCIITLDYNKIGSVTEFTIPDEIKEIK